MLERLSSVTRWCRDNPVQRESLLEHTGWVCTAAMHIAMQLKQNGDFVDVGEILQKAVLHDIEEGLTGDISGPSKHYSPTLSDQVKEMESDAIYCWMGFLDIKDRQYHALWSHSKDSTEMSGAIIKIADYLAVVYKIWLEASVRGNKGFKRVAKELKVYSPQAEEWTYNISSKSNQFLDKLRLDAKLIIDSVIAEVEVEPSEIQWLV